MATKLPRGVRLATWKNKDGTSTTKYRVEIKRKGWKGETNKLFDSLQEAVSYLALSKLKKGQELLYSISEEERIKKNVELQQGTNKDFSFGFFAQKYLEDYVFNQPADTELKRRNQAMKKAFITKICNISIVDRYLTPEEKDEMGLEKDEIVYRFFKGFDVRTQIKPIDINNYIKTRLKGDKVNRAVKPVSVVREITFISNVFNKLIHFDESLEDIRNPTRDYDKSLLQNVVNVRKRVLSDQEEEKFLEVINGYSNKQLADICKISLLTSMRRSEIVFLKKDQIRDDFKYIHLPITKSKKSRDVYLDETAREFFRQLQPAEKAKDGRFFTYSNSGFGKVFADLMKRNGLENIHFHDLRRTKISRMLSIGGDKNTILIAKLLGFQSVRKFEDIHLTEKHKGIETQEAMLSTFGHGNIDTNYKHYFNPVLSEVDKIERMRFLKEKKKVDNLTPQENDELLSLLIELTN
ncbi:site-specific integrase [Burkholderia multivorans]|uniref:Integrase n=2 Tax=Burkholderiaceae TaxID=119060 RepID=A0A1V2W197_9BURK|nr:MULTISPECIES: site-specific integrase [Burkholderiaceae]MDN7868127.1 site-specific integrase [Burkholderia multivorans]ONU42156.1 integrase [Burkholderia cenocepacia]ONU42791.1 integrase [Burkholderia cenocepacia]ONU50968.1 integrase [Burkholderia cenocepacia]ONU55289.1 integrase [Burkholderia cenocepacia]